MLWKIGEGLSKHRGMHGPEFRESRKSSWSTTTRPIQRESGRGRLPGVPGHVPLSRGTAIGPIGCAQNSYHGLIGRYYWRPSLARGPLWPSRCRTIRYPSGAHSFDATLKQLPQTLLALVSTFKEIVGNHLEATVDRLVRSFVS